MLIAACQIGEFAAAFVVLHYMTKTECLSIVDCCSAKRSNSYFALAQRKFL